MTTQRRRDADALASGRLDGWSEQLLRDRLDEPEEAVVTHPTNEAAERRARPTLRKSLLLTFALPDFYADDLAGSADFYDGDLTEAFYNEAGLISSTARLSIMSGDKGGNDLHSMRAVLVSADVVDRVPAHDEPEDERLTEAILDEAVAR